VSRLKPDNRRKWRVSAYAPGAKDLATYPLVHKASRDREIAQGHFDRLSAQIGKGKIGRVVMHQGLLYRGYGSYIHYDTDWKKSREERQ